MDISGCLIGRCGFRLGVVLLAVLTCGPGARAASAPPDAWRIYVTNEIDGTLSVIDSTSQKVVSTLKLGKRPRGLQVTADGRLLYVALSGSPIMPPGSDESKAPAADKSADGIGVVDTVGLRLLRVITGVSDPEQLGIGRDGTRLYVASEDTGYLLVLDARDGRRIAALPVGGEPEGVTVSPDGRFVYTTSEADSIVSVLETASDRLVARFAVGKRPRVSAFSSDGGQAWVTGEMDASVSVVDPVRHVVLRKWQIPGENVRPMGVVSAPDGRELYVATGRGGMLVALDAGTGAVRAQVAVGTRPWNVALSPDGRYLYTANGPSNDIAVVDRATLQVVRKIAVGDRPWGVIVGPLPVAGNRSGLR